MEDTVIGLDSHTVENRKVVLENDMIEQWSSVNKESDGLYAALARLLDEHEMDIQGFLGSDDVQEEYLEAVFYEYGRGFAVQFHFRNLPGAGK